MASEYGKRYPGSGSVPDPGWLKYQAEQRAARTAGKRKKSKRDRQADAAQRKHQEREFRALEKLTDEERTARDERLAAARKRREDRLNG